MGFEMNSNEDDEADKMMERKLLLEKELAELEKALRAKQTAAATAQGRRLGDEVVVVSDEKDGGRKSLDVIGMRERGFDAKTLESLNVVGSQTVFRCPQPNCLWVFRHERDLIEHQENTHSTTKAGQLEVSSQNGASSSQLQDHRRITDIDGQSVNEEVLEIIVLSDDEKDKEDETNWGDAEDAQLDQISESNQETVIEMEETEKTDQDDETAEAGETDGAEGDDELNGRDSTGTLESGDDVALPEEDEAEPDDGDSLAKSEDDVDFNPDDETDTDDNEIDSDYNETHSVAGFSKSSSRFRCQHPGCARSFKIKSSLKQHQYIHKTLFQCQVCQMCFKSRHGLIRHQPVHSDDRPFACDWPGCGGTYKLEYQMKLHRKEVHLNKRLFQCDKQGCGKLLKSKNSLYNHLKYTHSSLRRIKCQAQGCGKRFKKVSHLKSHMNHVHSDIRKFRCHFKNCEKTFKSRQILTRHLKIHK